MKQSYLFLYFILSFALIMTSCNKTDIAVSNTNESEVTSKMENSLRDNEIYIFEITNAFKADYINYMVLKTIQGIVNRGKPILYVENKDRSEYPFRNTDQEWRKIIEKKKYTFRKIESFIELYTTFKAYFKGLIIINNSVTNSSGYAAADTDFACTVASLTDYVPVTKNLLSMVKAKTGLSFIDNIKIGDFSIGGDISKSLRGKKLTKPHLIYEYAFENLLKKGYLNQSSVMGMVVAGMDYAVKNKMLFYTLSPSDSKEEHDVYDKILSYLKSTDKVWNMYGWVQEESSGLKYTSKNGGIIDCIADGNLSLLSSLPGPKSLKQKANIQKIFDRNKIYVTFMASENDTIKTMQSFQHGSWLDPNRGKVPINWGAIADAIVEFPFMMQYYYETATENDYFFSGGGSSMGFIDPDEQMPEKARRDLEVKNKQYMPLVDQKYIDFYTDGYSDDDIFTPKQVVEYLKNSGINDFISRINSIEEEAGLWEQDVFFFNRGKNMYPTRIIDANISMDDMKKTEKLWEDKRKDSYIYLSVTFKSTDKFGVKLFTQTDGSSYKYEISGDQAILSVHRVGSINKTTQLVSKTIALKPENRLIAVADKSLPNQKATNLKFYINDDEIAEVEDSNFSRGGFEIFSNSSVLNEIVTDIQGANKSQEMQIAESILSDDRKFIVGFYGYIFDRKYSNNQMNHEPGFLAGEVVTLSPTTILNIVDILNKSRPGLYEVVNLDEFMTFSKSYYKQHSTIK